MTVAELIEIPEEFDPDKQVVCDGQDGDIARIEEWSDVVMITAGA